MDIPTVALALIAALFALCFIYLWLSWLARNARNVRVRRFAWCVLYTLVFFTRNEAEPWEKCQAEFFATYGECP